ILRSVSFARSALFKEIVRSRTRGSLETETLHKTQCREFRASIKFQSAAVSSPFGSVIASILPDWRRLRTAFERTRTPSARAVRIFVRGQRTICNFCRPHTPAGKVFSFLRALVQDANQTASRIFHAFSFTPVHSA